MPGITVVVLAYNEEARIGDVLARIGQAAVSELKVVVVDDGSSDNTARIASSFGDVMAVEVVRHPVNLGVARAFDTGLRHAASQVDGDGIIVTMEGDGTSDVGILGLLVEKVSTGSDIVCASRFLPGGGYYDFPVLRKLLSLSANRFMRLCFRVPGVHDYTIFYRAYRGAVLRDVIKKHGERFIESSGFVANAEILIKIHRLGTFRFAEVPLKYLYGVKRSKSKMRVGRNLREYFKFVIRNWR